MDSGPNVEISFGESKGKKESGSPAVNRTLSEGSSRYPMKKVEPTRDSTFFKEREGFEPSDL